MKIALILPTKLTKKWHMAKQIGVTDAVTNIDGEPDIVKVDLDVTLENDAKFLYKSVGFKNVREYSMYNWVNEGE